MYNVKIRLKLKDGSGNVSFLDIHSDDFGVLHYALSGKHGMPYALSNAQIKDDLPATVHDYSSRDLLWAITKAVNTGVDPVNEIVFALVKESDHIPRKISTRA